MLQHVSGSIKGLMFKRHDTESLLFYLHCQVTFMILTVCSIAVTSNLYAGDPIVCTTTLEFSPRVMASYCWSHSTYSVATAYGEKPGRDVPQPGIDISEDESEYIYRDYYQWIYIVLFIQGVFFRIPHLIWRSMDDGKMDDICENIGSIRLFRSEIVDDDASQQDVKTSRNDHVFAGATFFHERLGNYSKYAFGYWLCEIMAWSNIILQTYFLDSFFQGEFLTLGKRVVEYFTALRSSTNPLAWIFPRTAKCHFHKIGPVGTVETVDVLCVLPVNALTEKIYLFLWFWFAALFLLSSARILLTILTVASPRIRGLRLSFQVAAVLSNAARETEILASRVGRIIGYGDWFVLSVIAERMDPVHFRKFLAFLEHKVMLQKKRNMIDKAENATAV